MYPHVTDVTVFMLTRLASDDASGE